MSSEKRAGACALAVALLLGLAGTARAQVGGSHQPQVSYEAVMKAPVGAWAEYTLSADGKQMSVRYALVARSSTTFGLEADSQTPIGPMQMRMDYVRSGADSFKLGRARVVMNGQPQELPAAVMQAVTLKKGATLGKLVGHERVSIAAGTFECKHYRMTTEHGTFDFWVDNEVYPTGMVKLSSSTGTRGALKARGTGAAAKIN